MERRSNLLYMFLLPTLFSAALALGYFTWDAAAQYEQIGARSIAASTLLVVEERVDRIERYIITQDNAALRIVRRALPGTLEDNWIPQASEVTPSVRAILVVTPTGELREFAARASRKDRQRFKRVFERGLLPDLDLLSVSTRRLKHLHTRYRGRPYLLSYQALQRAGEPLIAVVQHDTGYIAREKFANLFAGAAAEPRFNVVDTEGRRVFGESLLNAGEYIVGRRFPTTLYGWRLQLAPRDAMLLEAKGRSTVLNRNALIVVCFGVILVGMGVLLYATSKERKLNDLKSEFIANVSHELKTPLSVVRMFAEMLQSARVKPEKRGQYLDIICRESERLTGLIENVLDFAALERGKQHYEPTETNLATIVQRAIDTASHRTDRNQQPIQFVPVPNLPLAEVDEQAIQLAIVNLLDNAIKYGNQLPITIEVGERAPGLFIEVRDNGPGIPEDEQHRVFERFFRGAAGSAKVAGSGIGLSLVEHIAAVHGGKAWAFNREAGGAAVGFSLSLRWPAIQPGPRSRHSRVPVATG